MLGLVLYFFLGFIIYQTRGLYQPGGVLLLAGGIAVLIAAFLRGGTLAWGRLSGRAVCLVLSLGIASSALVLFFEPALVYVRIAQWIPTLSACLAIAVVGAMGAVGHEIGPKAGLARASLLGLLLAGIALVVARVIVLWIAPAAAIDVWVFNTMACDFMAEGKNPYSILYPDIYHGKWPYSPYNCYPPGYLLCAFPFRVGLGEVRLAHAFADLVAAGSLYAIAKRNGVRVRAALMLAVAWLVTPVSLYVIDQSLVDPVVSAWAGLFFLALTWRRWVLAAFILGVLCTIKQYAFIIGLGSLPWLIAQVPRRQWLTCGAVVFGTAAVIVAPFALTDWNAFLTSVVLTIARFPLRLDAFNLSSYVANEYDLRLPSFVSTALTLLALAGGLMWLWRRSERRLADAAGYVVLCFSAVFLFGPQASCNYYQLLTYFILLALALNGLSRSKSQPVGVAGDSALQS